MKKIYSIILAAGKGTRMGSDLPKVLHAVGGMTMASHVILAAERAGIENNILVVGHKADHVKSSLDHNVIYALQKEQKGTGHAVLMAEGLISEPDATVVVLAGDAPLISPGTISKLISYHQETGADVTVLTAVLENPYAYGRIIRDDYGNLNRIVEEKDATTEEKGVNEVNTGVYAFNSGKLFEALHQVGTANAQGEYYLTDVLGIIKKEGGKIRVLTACNAKETLGVNTPEQLAEVEKIYQARNGEQL